MAGDISASAAPDPGENGSGDPLRRLATRLAADREWIAAVSREVTEAIHRELPQLARDEELRAATSASVESNVRQLIEILRAGRDPGGAGAPAVAVEYVAEYVRWGVTVDALLRASQVGQECFIHRLSAAARASIEGPDDLSETLERSAATTLAYINAMIRDLIAHYERERDRWVRSAAAVRAETVRALLAGERIDLAAAEKRLSYGLQRTHLAFVVWAPPPGAGADEIGLLERAAAGLAADLGARSRLLVPLGPNLIAGWAAGREQRAPDRRLQLDVEVAPQARASLGSPGSGVEGFARSHHQAMQARRVAELAERRPGSVVAYDDVALSALASADADHAREFVHRQLGPLASDDDDTLRLAGTLRVYLEERSSPSRTAERLGVHANTVANRIRSVQDLLGEPIDTRVAELLVALRLAPLVRKDS